MIRRSGAWGKLAVGAAAVAMFGACVGTMGCAIHTQGPIKEIAYDFSDRDFYDRAYATSPQYLEQEGTYVGATPTVAPHRGQHAPLRKAVPVSGFEQPSTDARSRMPALAGINAPATVLEPAAAQVDIAGSGPTELPRQTAAATHLVVPPAAR